MAPILVISADPDLPHERPPVSKDFRRGETGDVALQSAQWFTEHAIELRRGQTVTAIDVDERTVTADGQRMPYRALVFGTGAEPLPVPGGARALP